MMAPIKGSTQNLRLRLDGSDARDYLLYVCRTAVVCEPVSARQPHPRHMTVFCIDAQGDRPTD